MKLPRIALLRGAYFGPFEAQNYEPLLGTFDIRAYVLPQNLFSLEGCRIPVSICRFPDARWLAGRSLLNAWQTRVRGEHYPMPGIDKIVSQSDVVHTFEAWYAYTRAAAKACERYGVPLVVTHWDTLPYEPTTEPATEAILKTYHTASRILAATEVARRALITGGVPAEKIVVQGMGIDVERFAPGERDPELMRQLGLENDDFVFLFTGRLAREKGVRELIQAFQLARAENANPGKLLMIGSGPEEKWIRSVVRSCHLESAVFLVSPKSYGEIHRWYRLADVFVFPSVSLPRIEEQFGYALVEALSTGCAVIATRSGGIPDVIGNAARMVPPGDIFSLAEAMALLRRDEAQRRKLAMLARDRAVEHFSSQVVSQRLARIYTELCP